MNDINALFIRMNIAVGNGSGGGGSGGGESERGGSLVDARVSYEVVRLKIHGGQGSSSGSVRGDSSRSLSELELGRSAADLGLAEWKRLGYTAVAIEQTAGLDLTKKGNDASICAKRSKLRGVKCCDMDVQGRITVKLDAATSGAGEVSRALRVFRAIGQHFDIVAVEPMSHIALDVVAKMLEVAPGREFELFGRDLLDIICVDVSQPKMTCRLTSPRMLQFRKLGVFCEISYRTLVAARSGDKGSERAMRARFIGNGRAAAAHVSKGHMAKHGGVPNFVLSSGARSDREVRNGFEVRAFAWLVGLKDRAADDIAFGKAGMALMAAAKRRRVKALPAVMPAK